MTTATLEERRLEQKALCDGMLPTLVKSLDWSAEQLFEHRTGALQELIRHVQENSPWLGKRVAHLDANSVTEDDLTSVAPMSKDDLLEHFDEIVTDPRLTLAVCEAHLASGGDEYLFDEYRVMATGGTSGVRAVVPMGWQEFAAASAMMRRPMVRWMLTKAPFAGRAPVLCGILPVRGAHFSAHHGWLHGQSAVPITAPIADIVAALNERQPDVLGIYPSLIPLLAAEAAAGQLTIAPSAVVCGGEPCFDDHRLAVKETWGAVVLDCYGAIEVMWVAQGCACHGGLQLCEDRAVIEPVDDEGTPVAAGETASTVLVTPLFSFTLPLIRYELTDRVTMAADRAPCAPGFRRLAAVDGRSHDAFTYLGVVVVHPILFRSALLTERHVLEYQVRQTPTGADIDLLTSGPVDADRLTKLVEADLSYAGVADPVVRVREVDSIARRGDGLKFPRMVPLEFRAN